MRHSIALIALWFGPWPPWIQFFLESCRTNADIDWFIVTDQPAPENTPTNVRLVSSSFEDYKKEVENSLGIRFAPEIGPYKLCDIRPALGHIHQGLIHGYDFFGWTDLDLIYGDIREFYDETILSKFDVVSAHAQQVSGHLFIMRNEPGLRSAFRQILDWRGHFESPQNTGCDEQAFHASLTCRNERRPWFRLGKAWRLYFKEAYSTPAPVDQMRWFWRDGRLWNEFFHREFLYLHFMAWQSNRWYFCFPEVEPGTKAPWERLDNVVQLDWRRAREDGFMISPNGIQTLTIPRYGVRHSPEGARLEL